MCGHQGYKMSHSDTVSPRDIPGSPGGKGDLKSVRWVYILLYRVSMYVPPVWEWE